MMVFDGFILGYDADGKDAEWEEIMALQEEQLSRKNRTSNM